MKLGTTNSQGQVENAQGRRAYGWQRHGGHGEYILCDVQTLIKLPDFLSYEDGAMIACGYGTAYSAVMKLKPTEGQTCFVIGLGPVGLAVAQVCLKLGAEVFGYEVVPGRREFAKTLGIKVIEDEKDVPIAEDGVAPRDVGFDITFDVTGAAGGRIMAIRSAKRWGTTMFIGGYNEVTIKPSPWILQKQLTIRGSWVFSADEGRQLCQDLVKWQLHPHDLISHRFSLKEADKAYELFSSGKANKVVIVQD
jgi:threonine dehydrogenase-like Zn-dependent dehydrogenase